MNTPAFDYDIVRAKRKTVAIHVENGKVQVRAPLRVSREWIHTFVTAQTDWVIKRLQKEAQQRAPAVAWESGTVLRYLGTPITLHITLSKKNNAVLEGDFLLLAVKKTEPDYIKGIFIEWLKIQAFNYMAPRAHQLAQQLGVAEKLTAVRLRVTCATWGHCSSKGVIQFNPLVMLTTPELVDYLIAHEVCHLRHMNHSPAYWALVASVCPTHTLLKKQLRGANPLPH